MANEEHLARLKQGVEAWNRWRKTYPKTRPNLVRADLAEEDLREADLYEANLFRADLHEADLTRAVLVDADLTEAKLHEADLTQAILDGANLTAANLYGATLAEANLTGANLTGANLAEAYLGWAVLDRATLTEACLDGANLTAADLTSADLSGADLTAAHLQETILEKANLTGCRVYAASSWDVNLVGAQQSNLIITPYGKPVITVDSLEVAQFIYLLLHNEKIREVIDTITSKAVLILGRFTPERKAVLDAIREEIRKQHLLPIVFDFTPSARQTTLETVSTLAHMSRFVIADLTDAKSILQELQAIVPHNPSVPVQPLLLASQEDPGMFDFIRSFPWVLETYCYHSPDEVLASLEQIITRADKARARSGRGTVQRKPARSQTPRR
jgi:Pentapeptide repeats (8 copies)